MAGRRNESGIKLQCPNVGYTWYYQGDADVTSCHRCGWRGRIRPSRKIATPAGDALLTDRKRERLI